MNTLKLLIVTTCALLLVATILSCWKENLPPNGISASFQIREVAYDPSFWDVALYDTDSVSTGEVAFIADEPQTDTTTYEWQVGTDSRTFKGKRLELDFRGAPTDTITVRLTVTKWDAAYTIKRESRSSSRMFYRNRKPLVLGTFEGSFEDQPAKKVVLKIKDQFVHPMFYNDHHPDYVGLLISTDMPGRDTVFVSNGESRHYVFHRKLPLLERGTITFSEYTFNHWIKGLVGEVVVDNQSKVMSMNIKAKDVKSGKEVAVKFSGRKTN